MRNILTLAAVAAALIAPAHLLAQSETRSPQEIDQIVGPIALYPDPLVSVVLPASTLPQDVQQAASLVASGDTSAVDTQTWDDSVRAVAHYPELVEWMSDNIDWTTQLGVTFANQPSDVMDSIQRLRAEARAAGVLVDSPQQRVVVEGSLISVVPVESTRIYVPHYDPSVVFVRGGHPGVAALTFSTGFALGAWLNYDFDWRARSVVVYDHAAIAHRDWTRPSFAVRTGGAGFAAATHRDWHPAANRPVANVNVNISKTIVTPHAFGDRTAGASRNAAERARTGATAQASIQSTNAISRERTSPALAQQNAQETARQNAQREEEQRRAGEASRMQQQQQRSQQNSAALAQSQAQQQQAERERNAAIEAQRNRATTTTTGSLSANERRQQEQAQARAQAQAQARSPQAPASSTPNAMANNNAEEARRQQAERQQQQQAESNRRAPRAGTLAGPTGEYPQPSAIPQKKESTPAASSGMGDLNQRRSEEQERARTQAQAQPENRTPASTGQLNTRPTLQQQQAQPGKSESSDEKAKAQQREEEDKKKKKPDGSDNN